MCEINVMASQLEWLAHLTSLQSLFLGVCMRPGNPYDYDSSDDQACLPESFSVLCNLTQLDITCHSGVELRLDFDWAVLASLHHAHLAGCITFTRDVRLFGLASLVHLKTVDLCGVSDPDPDTSRAIASLAYQLDQNRSDVKFSY